jgi:hypothetical protein
MTIQALSQEQAPEPNAQEAKKVPGAIVHPNLELKRTARCTKGSTTLKNATVKPIIVRHRYQSRLSEVLSSARKGLAL